MKPLHPSSGIESCQGEETPGEETPGRIGGVLQAHIESTEGSDSGRLRETLLEQAGADNLDSGSSLHVAWGRDEGRHTGGLNENFRVVNLEEAEATK